MADMAESGVRTSTAELSLQSQLKIKRAASVGLRRFVPFLALVFLVLVILAYYLGTTRTLTLHGNFVNLRTNTVIQYFSNKDKHEKVSTKTRAQENTTAKDSGQQGTMSHSNEKRKRENITWNHNGAVKLSESSHSKKGLDVNLKTSLPEIKSKQERNQFTNNGSNKNVSSSPYIKQTHKETTDLKIGNSTHQSYSSNLPVKNYNKNSPEHKVQTSKNEKTASVLQKLAIQDSLSRGEGNFDYDIWHKKKITEICGTGWQAKYKELHADILSRRREEKYLVYLCPGTRQGCCGYGNRLRAVASLFYLAVLTDRAFLIDWRAPEPIENHLPPRNIQWNSTAPLDICAGLEIRKHYWGTAKADIREAEGWIIQDSHHFKKWLTSTDLESYFNWPVEEITTIWNFAEGGITRNPLLMKRAKELGVKPLLSDTPIHTRIGCAFDFLFSKSEALENQLRQVKRDLQLNKGPLIGIHIRTGDDQFDYYSSDNDRTWNLKNVSRLTKFFDCAQEVEKKLYGNDDTKRSKVRWFVSTDHMRVRKFAKDSYPRRVVTTNLTIQHLDILFNTTMLNFTSECNYTDSLNTTMVCYNVDIFNVTEYCANRTNTSVDAENNTTINSTGPYTEGITAMLIDHFILAESDFLILCDSSFGSTAVGLSMRNTDSYTLGDQGCVDLVSAQKKTRLRFFGR